MALLHPAAVHALTTAIGELSFTPKELVQVPVGRLHARLYPAVDTSMPVHERAHAFQVNSTAIRLLPVDQSLQLDALGNQLNSIALVEGIKADFVHHFDENWANFQYMEILSFHNSAGAIINDTTIAGDQSVLKPIQNGAVDQCRCPDVKYVRVKLTLDFAQFITLDPPGATNLRAEYYIELPQTSVAMVNGHGNNYQLVTYHGPEDLRTMAPANFRAAVLDQCQQDGPIDLGESQFNLTSVTIDTTNIREVINKKILQLAYPQIMASLFSNLCPNYSDQPHAALEHIRQSYVDNDGQTQAGTVHGYYQRMMNAARPFSTKPVFPVSLCNKFMEGLDPRLMPSFRKKYRNHSIIHQLDGPHQRRELQQILLAAVEAEEEYYTTQQIARDAVSQTFHANTVVNGASVHATTVALPSQAESTIIAKYDRKCFGCGGPHNWVTRANGESSVTCPNKDKPGMAQSAADNYAKFKERMKKLCAARKSRGKKRAVKMSGLDADDQEALRAEVRALLLAEGFEDKKPTKKPAATPSMVFVIDITVLSAGSPTKLTLPVQIQQHFPHILLHLGSATDPRDSPGVKFVVDSAAALSTGNFHFFAKIAKKYPHCISRILVPEDYAPITLSGIVQRNSNAKAVTTELNVAFEFHLPYRTRSEGDTTAIMVATGAHVTVNAILGVPFMQATGLHMDMVDNVIDLKHLDCEPFPIIFQRTHNHVPVMDCDPDAHYCARLQEVVDAVDRLEQYFASAYVMRPQAAVTFGSSLGNPAASHKNTTGLRGGTARRSSYRTSLHTTGESSHEGVGRCASWQPPMGDPPIMCAAHESAMWTKTPAVVSTQASMDDMDEDDDSSYNLVADDVAEFMRYRTRNRIGISDATLATPIHVTPKRKSHRKPRNVFLDDRGFPDESDAFDQLLSNIDGGSVLRKLKHPTPPIDVIDPEFNVQFDESIHGEFLRKSLDLSHLRPQVQDAVYALIKKYWPVFEESTIFVPVKNYQCVIDTGSASPIAVKKIQYGPREAPIMRKCIAALEKVGHIRQIQDGRWMFKALLAPKPHQEHVHNIDDFVWRFCVNYIPLNQVTRLIAYPIPRCDDAVLTCCGRSKYFWIFDAPMGYHQLQVSADSQEKLAFQGPDAIKWTYTVMPFGPTNGPATFIAFIHDLDSVWKTLARKLGIKIDDDTNTVVIVDDIFNWAMRLRLALAYMECQLRVCKAYRLSLKLSKCHIFPSRVEFVGIDVCVDGNRPAMAKFELIRQWPAPETVRDIAKLIGFGQFYSRFIPNFELQITPLRHIISAADYVDLVAPHWSDDAQKAWDFIKESILSDPCLKRYDHRKLTVLRTDFSAIGFGYVACQPADDDASIAAMRKCFAGDGIDFMTDSDATLHPVAFGSRRSRGNETKLHSHLGEGFAGDWAINKCRHMCYGQRFVWATDCSAIRFILSYEGGNPAVLRLQMRLMGWDMDVVHRRDKHLVDADYWSRLGSDLCFDPLLRKYLELVQVNNQAHPAPVDLPMQPRNMPYYRGPRIQHGPTPEPSPDTSNAQTADVTLAMSLFQACTVAPSTPLIHIPVKFGSFPRDGIKSPPRPRSLYNSELCLAAWQLSSFSWAIYSLNSGHFISTMRTEKLPFRIHLACDPLQSGRAILRELADCDNIFSTANEMLHFIRAAGDTTLLHGYLIHSHRHTSSDATRQFWDIQSSIVTQLRLINKLCVVVAFVQPDQDKHCLRPFLSSLKRDKWITTVTPISYPSIGDCIADSTTVIIAVHSSASNGVSPVHLRAPPMVTPPPVAKFCWVPFDVATYSVGLSPGDPDFGKDDSGLVITPVTDNVAMPGTIKYFVHRGNQEKSLLAGAAVIDKNTSLCPPYTSALNDNLFGCFFGIEYIVDGHTHIRSISPFEFVSCFGFDDEVKYKMSHPTLRAHFDAGIPARTSAWVFLQVYQRLQQIREENSEIVDIPAVNTMTPINPPTPVQSFLNGTIAERLPSHQDWVKETAANEEFKLIMAMIADPSTIVKSNLERVNYNYRHPLRNSLIGLEDGLLIYREPLRGSPSSYIRLQLVPKSLRNIVFVAFHSNPIGGHFNAYRTLHRIRLRFYWPKMYAYIVRLCSACPGCALANPTKSRSAELVYRFPIKAPFQVLFVDAYMAGKVTGFENSECYLIACCGMSTFAAMEPITNPTSTTFASAIMKIQLRFGFCHTIVLDKDSKFLGVCKEALDLLQINRHVLSGGNHNPMLVERVNRYLNKGLKILTTERGSARVALESILLLLYAWNLCPIPGTDISRSMVAVGREFAFPIDYSRNAHLTLTSSSPETVTSYSKELALRLSACREIAHLLLQEQRAWHRELVISRTPDPRLYSVGDIVFARRSVQSSKTTQKVDKLTFAYTGPWRITRSLPGASYELQHCLRESRVEKKHASDLSPYPDHLLPFQPLDGPDSRYSQLHKSITPNPYLDAGITGFIPPQPFQTATEETTQVAPAAFAQATLNHDQFYWPSLAELNEELIQQSPDILNSLENPSIGVNELAVPSLYTGPPPPAPSTNSSLKVPPLPQLIANIISSTDKLFFVSVAVGTGDAREWKLIRISFVATMAVHPSCLQDGRFLVDFYLCHPSDCRFNAINQRYWIHYVPRGALSTDATVDQAHLIRPADSSEDYAKWHHLVSIRRWLNVSHRDTFIHGPFEFATIRGRKSRDRVSQDDWDFLAGRSNLFDNKVPDFSIPSYSVHVGHCYHVETHIPTRYPTA